MCYIIIKSTFLMTLNGSICPVQFVIRSISAVNAFEIMINKSTHDASLFLDCKMKISVFLCMFFSSKTHCQPCCFQGSISSIKESRFPYLVLLISVKKGFFSLSFFPFAMIKFVILTSPDLSKTLGFFYFA